KINAFLYQLFNVKEGEIDKLVATVTEYYTVNHDVFVITVKDNIIAVQVLADSRKSQKASFDHLIDLCEKRQFADAYPLVAAMVGQAPNHSELNRIKGQIESELGETDKAIDSLIDALRWDPDNIYALIMMGNIF